MFVVLASGHDTVVVASSELVEGIEIDVSKSMESLLQFNHHSYL